MRAKGNGARRTRRAALAALAPAALACAATPVPAPPEEPLPAAIEIDGGTPRILFEKVILRLPAGTVYGHVHNTRRRGRFSRELVHTSKHTEVEEFNILISDRMAELGYDVIDPTEAVFSPDHTVTTRFRIVGVITHLDLQTYHDPLYPKRSYQTAELDMEVRLYDANVKGVVYSETFEGAGRDDGSSPVALPGAVQMAVEGALADERFVELVTARGPRAAAASEALRLPRCPELELRLPADIAAVSKAVVTVRQGDATGSGVLISPLGHVLTAAHLVSDHDAPRVGLGVVELEATVERIDRVVDVALLKIPGTGHHCTPLHAGDPVELGAALFAVGVPLDQRLAGSVSRGIVSGRPTIDGQRLLQTDASVNPGNSGGPVYDEHGRVVGVVTSKFFGIGVEGLGFAIPAEGVREALVLEAE